MKYMIETLSFSWSVLFFFLFLMDEWCVVENKGHKKKQLKDKNLTSRNNLLYFVHTHPPVVMASPVTSDVFMKVNADGDYPLSKPPKKMMYWDWKWSELGANSGVEAEDMVPGTAPPAFVNGWFRNPHITVDVLRSCPQTLKNYEALSRNPAFTAAMLEADPGGAWNWRRVSRHKNLRWADVEKHPAKIVRADKAVYVHGEVKFYDPTEYPCPWDWDWLALSEHPAITWEQIRDHTTLPWVWSAVSRRRDITAAIVLQHPLAPWCWGELASNPSIDWSPELLQHVLPRWEDEARARCSREFREKLEHLQKQLEVWASERDELCAEHDMSKKYVELEAPRLAAEKTLLQQKEERLQHVLLTMQDRHEAKKQEEDKQDKEEEEEEEEEEEHEVMTRYKEDLKRYTLNCERLQRDQERFRAERAARDEYAHQIARLEAKSCTAQQTIKDMVKQEEEGLSFPPEMVQSMLRPRFNKLSANPGLRWATVEAFLEYPWDWSALSAHPSTTWEFMQAHPQFPWHLGSFCTNPNFNDAAFYYRPCDWNHILLSANPALQWKWVEGTMKLKKEDGKTSRVRWRWEALTENPAITPQIILQNLHCPWVFRVLHKNPNFSWDLVRQHPQADWNWPMLSWLPDVPRSLVEELQPLCPSWDWHGISRNMDVHS